MSKEASDELKKAMDARLKVLAAKTPVKVIFNINQACAVKVAIKQLLDRLYDDQPDDDFSKEIREAWAVIQAALDNC